MTSIAPKSPLRIVVAAGGTVGHCEPALVVAEELRARGHHVQMVGADGGVEIALSRERRFDITTYPIAGFPRRVSLKLAKALARATVAIPRCRRILRTLDPDVVLGGGGFVAAPVVVAARTLGIPAALTEADAHLGFANRLAVRSVVTLCTAWQLDGYDKIQVVTGRPVAQRFFDVNAHDARASLRISSAARVLVVVGGSAGARRINESVRDAFLRDERAQWRPDTGGAPIVVLHIVGRRDFAEWHGTEWSAEDGEEYRVIEYAPDLERYFAAADLVVSRAGGSIFELAAVGRAAVLVPYPHATGDHQTRNAHRVADAGGAVVLADDSCTQAAIRAEVAALLSIDGDTRRTHMAQAFAGLARRDAAAQIANLVEQAALTKRRDKEASQ